MCLDQNYQVDYFPYYLDSHVDGAIAYNFISDFLSWFLIIAVTALHV